MNPSLKADVLEDLTRSIDAICASRDPAEDSEVRTYRDYFTAEEWTAILEAARASMRSAVAGSVLAKYMTGIAESMGLVVDRDALQVDLFVTIEDQREGQSELGNAALRRRPGGEPLMHALGVNGMMAVIAASGEIEDLLSS